MEYQYDEVALYTLNVVFITSQLYCKCKNKSWMSGLVVKDKRKKKKPALNKTDVGNASPPNFSKRSGCKRSKPARQSREKHDIADRASERDSLSRRRSLLFKQYVHCSFIFSTHHMICYETTQDVHHCRPRQLSNGLETWSRERGISNVQISQGQCSESPIVRLC